MRWQKRSLLGQFLLNQGAVAQEQLDAALDEQKRTKELLGQILLRKGYISDEQVILTCLSDQLHIETISLKQITPDANALARLPAKAANYYKVFPINMSNGVLKVAVHDPLDLRVLDDLNLMARCPVVTVLASQKEIIEAIREHYGLGAETIEQMMGTTAQMSNEQEVTVIDEADSDASISRFLNQILLQAYKDHATDVHIEPFEESLRIRYRIDGVLYDAGIPSNLKYFADVLITRVKVLANLNIAQKRLPQDGRFKVKVADIELDLRVSFLPTSYGESVVIRILNSVKLLSLEELGFGPAHRETIKQLLETPHGIIFVTGPTGSGKTTTLYACLSAINSEETKIITIEDPIEYQLKGIVQVQAFTQIGLTFASILRSVLRNDPDVIMVGEVRDAETAQITIQTALTGHLVFSTLHTNDAASAVTRLLDMGIEPYLIASSVECFVAQRLVRTLCPHCKQKVPLTQDIAAEFGIKAIEPSAVVYKANGCKHCRMTGYVGREIICETLKMNDEIRALIMKQATAQEILQKATMQGMQTMRAHGLSKILAGITTTAEVLQATQE